MIDRVPWLNDNEMLLTDWTTGSLLLWTKSAGVQKLASGFGGPADLCANLHPMRKPEMRVVVPDILNRVVRIMWFSIGDTVLSK